MPTLFAMSGYLVWAYAYINIYIPSLFSFYSTDFRFPPSFASLLWKSPGLDFDFLLFSFL